MRELRAVGGVAMATAMAIWQWLYGNGCGNGCGNGYGPQPVEMARAMAKAMSLTMAGAAERQAGDCGCATCAHMRAHVADRDCSVESRP